MQNILVWDWPTRVGHWLLAACFVVAYVTGESEEWRLVHVMAGGALGGIVAFRLLWGLIGTRHARFTGFVASPMAAWDYLMGLARLAPRHFTGHNPAGGYAVLGLLLLGLLTVATGWPLYQEMDELFLNEDILEELHEGVANAMLLLVFIHLGGVLVGSLAHGENLARAMVTGRKQGEPEEAITSARLWAVPLLLAAALAAGWWLSR